MAEKEKKSFPMLPGAHWWALRDKFRLSIPGVVTDSYLAAALTMQAQSARANVLPYLRDIGLIDEDGKTRDLAKRWRDDAQYENVCREIREHLYPEDLRSAAPDSSTDRVVIERWFANHTGAGASAVRRMTQFYLILLEANASKKPTLEARPAPLSKRLAPAKPSKAAKITPTQTPSSPPQQSAGRETLTGHPSLPEVSINLQIHISADATPDQIDKIFESMAKHIYKK